ncbi:MAG: glycosyltransferase [Candidatus Magasanikbacteria bacterium]|nr:glycosyltransferase [Candidatus Magasanikbacteria bacterium]
MYTITQGHWGGAQKYVADLTLSLSKEPDYEVTVACGEQHEGFFAVLKNSQVKTIHLPNLVRAINPLKDVIALYEMSTLLKNGQFDVVHANSSKAGFMTALAHAWLKTTQKKSYHAQLIYTAHGWVFMEPMNPIKKIMYRAMERVASACRAMTIVLSEKEKSIAMRALNIPAAEISVIPNGIDCARIHFFDQQTARKNVQKFIKSNHTEGCGCSLEQHSLPCVVAKENIRTSVNPSGILCVPRDGIAEKRHFVIQNNERTWIGTIANLYKTKGIDIFIRAASILRAQNDTIKINGNISRTTTPCFFVIGEGPERARLRELIQKLNLDDSFFLIGAISNAAQYLKAFDIFVLPSLKEGFPYTILEASCAGTPIIASDVGAIPEILRDKNNGLLVPHGNSEQLASAITHILNDQALYTKLKTFAPAIADTFSLEAMVEKTKKVYAIFSAPQPLFSALQ